MHNNFQHMYVSRPLVLVCHYVVCLMSCCIDSVDEDKMLATGISRFCEDAALDPTSSTVLILAWKFKAATQCEFTRAEFVGGMAELGYVITDKMDH